MILTPPNALHFGRRASKRTMLASMVFTLGVGAVGTTAYCAKNNPDEDTQHGETTSKTVMPPVNQARLANTFSNSRGNLVDELNIAGSPSGVQNVKTDQVPGQEPDKGKTAWDLRNHHYVVGWDLKRDTVDPMKSSNQITVEITDENGQVSSLKEIRTVQDPKGTEHLTYTGPDGQTSRITSTRAKLKAAQLIESLINVSKAISGENYTPDADWSTSWQAGATAPSPSTAPTKTPSPVPSTSATPTPAPSASATPTETPTPTPSVTPTPEPTQHNGKPRKSFRLMAQNLLGIYHPGAMRHWHERMAKVVGIMKGHNAEIMTTTEGEAPQVNLVKHLLGDRFDSFPAHYSHAGGVSQRTIFYETKAPDGTPMWELKDSGVMKYPSYGDNSLDHPHGGAPWVRLRYAPTGQETVILSIHPVSWNNDPPTDRGGAQKRERTAHLITQWYNQMKAKYPDAVIVAAGDFNSSDYIRPHTSRVKDLVLGHDRSRLPACILGGDGLRDVQDIASHLKGACPPNVRGIDRMFTDAPSASHPISIRKGQSDHPALLDDIGLKQ